jgi:hypothetical protein
MGIFVDYLSNDFAGLKDTQTTIVTATTNVIWVTSIIITNKGVAPIRFNLQKIRTKSLDLENACYAATTTNLTAIYNNGTNGVGATLTKTGPLAAFSVDSLAPSLNARILVKDQNNAFQNGIYTLTTIGNGSVPWVLTRSTDYNVAAKIHNGDLIPVINGAINANTNWLQTSIVTVIGTNPIIFVSNIPTKIFPRKEFEIKPYDSVNIIDSIGVLNLVYSRTPYVTDSLICFSDGYTQVFDCIVNYAQLNELPLS